LMRAASGGIDAGFPHGSSPWAEGPRESGKWLIFLRHATPILSQTLSMRCVIDGI
jgi:hypothetical protein